MKDKAVAQESTKQATAKSEKKPLSPRVISRPFRATGGYFKGAWQELRQVHWPNRTATWGLTLAVVLFSVFFAGLILGLDTLFHYLFKEVLL